jgi:hypothetical protein
MHIAEPAFLLTRDGGLIRAVDESGTYQAPWALRLPEPLDGPLPDGRPWGRQRAARRGAIPTSGSRVRLTDEPC